MHLNNVGIIFDVQTLQFQLNFLLLLKRILTSPSYPLLLLIFNDCITIFRASDGYL